MASVTICRKCAIARGIQAPPNSVLPSMRTTRQACDFCGGYDEIPGGGKIDRNYTIDSIQVPGTADDPNRQAELEQGGRT